MVKIICRLVALAAVLCCGTARADAPAGAEAALSPFPQVVLSNGTIKLAVYVPDAERGYYRGPRFDWSGQIARLEYEGHTVFGEWKLKPEPEATDNAVGPAEEFGMSAAWGYAEAKAGETFLKIGVGLLLKPDDTPYQFFQPYKIVRAAPWEVTLGGDWIEFRQQFSDGKGRAYSYTKRISLEAGSAAFSIHHRLRNVGDKPLASDFYTHNFMVLDGQVVGPSHRLELPFAAPDPRPLKKIGEVRGREIRFGKELPPGQALYAELKGLGVTAADNAARFELENGPSVAFKGDWVPSKMVFYASGKAICIEPFLDIKLAPGQVKNWVSRYTLSLTE